MKIVIITQSDPFYLGKNIDYLLNNLPLDVELVGCIVSDASPFGKKESFIEKALKTFKIFGLIFFLRYSIRYIIAFFKKDNDVKYVLRKHNIPLIPITESINSRESLDAISLKSPDLLISISGNEIFRKPLIDLASYGCLNLHTAALPKYRGLMPSFWVLKNGEKKTAVSVFYVDEGIDSGPILVQKDVMINNMNQEQLIRETKKIGMDCIIEAIIKILNNDTATLPNNDEDMTYFSFPKKSDVIEFKRRGAKFF